MRPIRSRWARRRASDASVRLRRRDFGPSRAARRSQQAGNANATTIVTGLISCDPVRRTPWGTIIVAEEAGATGGFYEILDPVHINAPINVSNRDLGTTSDPLHLVKRMAVGSLSFESFVIRPDGTMIYGDELAPSGEHCRRRHLKFVPTVPFAGGPNVTIPAQSPLASGTIFRTARRGLGFVELGPGRGNGEGSLDAGQRERSRRDQCHGKHHSAQRASAAAIYRLLPPGRHGHRSDSR
jgi:hypothetical protein